MAERIGFIGLGIMGKPMARNVLRAGYPLAAHNRSPSRGRELEEEGATLCISPREVAQRSDIVFVMVSDSPAVEEVVLGQNGVLEGGRAGIAVVDMSSISPIVTKRIAAKLEEREMDMLDAPVSGGELGAIEGMLSIMVGGKPEVFERVRPIFEKMGGNIVHVGGNGAGQTCKLCNQIVVGLAIEAVGEALVFAAKAGVDPAKVREALLGGFAQSRVLDLHGQRMLEGNFEPGGKARLHQKDTENALSSAKEFGVSLPGTALVAQMWKALAAQGKDELDHSALVTILEEMANTEVGHPSGKGSRA
jgi:2-hydroxy-3-oxopropionate reductase